MDEFFSKKSSTHCVCLRANWLLQSNFPAPSITGYTHFKIDSNCPGRAGYCSLAYFITPQSSCPNKISSGTCSFLTAYSILSLTFGPTAMPATRTTNSSPMPQSKIISGTTRESEQLSTHAYGSWYRARLCNVCSVLLIMAIQQQCKT